MVAAVALKQTNKQKQLPSEPEDVMVTKYKDRFLACISHGNQMGPSFFRSNILLISRDTRSWGQTAAREGQPHHGLLMSFHGHLVAAIGNARWTRPNLT